MYTAQGGKDQLQKKNPTQVQETSFKRMKPK